MPVLDTGGMGMESLIHVILRYLAESYGLPTMNRSTRKQVMPVLERDRSNAR
jgi:antitoxin component of RelBE/YafQ-DinJ toxin-antitoxin module